MLVSLAAVEHRFPILTYLAVAEGVGSCGHDGRRLRDSHEVFSIHAIALVGWQGESSQAAGY